MTYWYGYYLRKGRRLVFVNDKVRGQTETRELYGKVIGRHGYVWKCTKDHVYIHWDGDASPDSWGYAQESFEAERSFEAKFRK